jgi:hypothetical protein
VHSSSSSLACSLASRRRRRSAYGPFALLSVSETSASFTSADVSPSQSQENDSPISTPAADPGAVADAARNLLLALQRERRETTAKSQADTEVAVSAFFAVVAPWSPSSERQIDALLVQLSAMAPHCGQAYGNPLRPLQLFAIRCLQRANAEVASAAVAARAVNGNPRVERASLRNKRRLLRGTSVQYARVRGLVGTQPNVYWRSVDREVLRAHISWENLPLTGALRITTTRDLRFLRQDCEAWFAARSMVQVNASTVWKALGFGETGAARRLGLSTSSGMRSHSHAMQAYRQMADPAPYAALRKSEDDSDPRKQVYMQFGSLHEAGAMLSYIGWENGVFSDSAAELRRSQGRRPEGVFSEMIRVQEAGLYILEDVDVPVEYGINCADVPVIAASPDGIVRRRRFDDFGAWEVQGTELVEIKCRVPFVPLGKDEVEADSSFELRDVVPEEEAEGQFGSQRHSSGKQRVADGLAGESFSSPKAQVSKKQSWLFRLIGPSRIVPAHQYAQVQFQMLCVGRHVRRTQLVSYAVMNGLGVMEVERNDAWLASALRVLGDFQRDFVSGGAPPPENFYADKPEYAAFVELTRDSMRAAENAATFVVPVDEVEACLLPQDEYQQQKHDKWRRDVFVRALAVDG